VTWGVSGLGSRLDLSHVTTVRGPAPGGTQTFFVAAGFGGVVELPHVATISEGITVFSALDGGQIHLTDLTSFTGATGLRPTDRSQLVAGRDGAAIVAPALTSLTNVDLHLTGRASLPVAGLATFQHGSITVSADRPTGVAGELALPLTTIDTSGFQADGTGSRLDLSHVTTGRSIFVSATRHLCLGDPRRHRGSVACGHDLHRQQQLQRVRRRPN
jgi:hypothetical protein